MNRTKISFGILSITTLVLMFATTIGSAMQSADARPDRSQPVNQQARGGGQGEVDQRGLVNVGVGNLGVQAQVAVPVNAQVCNVNVLGEQVGTSCR